MYFINDSSLEHNKSDYSFKVLQKLIQKPKKNIQSLKKNS